MAATREEWGDYSAVKAALIGAVLIVLLLISAFFAVTDVEDSVPPDGHLGGIVQAFPAILCFLFALAASRRSPLMGRLLLAAVIGCTLFFFGLGYGVEVNNWHAFPVPFAVVTAFLAAAVSWSCRQGWVAVAYPLMLYLWFGRQ